MDGQFTDINLCSGHQSGDHQGPWTGCLSRVIDTFMAESCSRVASVMDRGHAHDEGRPPHPRQAFNMEGVATGGEWGELLQIQSS